MKYTALILIVLLGGCSTTVPITQRFPQAPEILLQQCQQLKEVNKDANLVDLTKIVVENYTQYYQCSALLEGWHQWYKTQQQIYKELK